MTTQPELPEIAPVPVPPRPALRIAQPPAESDVDFDGFVRNYESRLRRLVLRRIGDISEAEEITQETLLRAYQHRASFRTEDELMAWSTVVAQRLVIDRVRVRGRSIAVPDVPENARLGRDTADVVVARHEARAALESLEAIPTRQAAILWAREVEGLHYEEIAERFGISEPAVRSLLHRGRRALRKEFKDRTGSLPLNGLAPFAPWLLALKAAGKMRGAAKAVGKAPATAVAALSLTALVAVGIGGGNGGAAEGRPFAIRPAEGGAARVTALAEPPEPVAREMRLHAASLRPSGDTSNAATGRRVSRPTDVGIVCYQRCLITTDDYFEGAVLQVGGDLPDNPLNMQNVKVSQDRVSCSTLAVPTNPAVSCTQHGTMHDPIPASDAPSVPRPAATPQHLEGAPR